LGSFSFSISAIDLFAGLSAGASLFPVDLKKEGIAGAIRSIEEDAITVYHSVPTVLRALLSALSEEQRLPGVRRLDLGGEIVRRRDVDRIFKHFPPHCVLVNGLGCTELNYIRQLHITRDTVVPTDPIPVGYPVDDTEVLLLGPDGLPVAQGETGELVIRSRYLALGYWRRPDLTEAVFEVD